MLKIQGMFIQQLYTGCLSEAAYFIESDGEAAVIDPLRDTAGYQSLAKEKRARIRYIFETHFHADFISGHLDLAEKTGATIVYGPRTITHFPIHLASDQEVFKIGKITLQVLHTPGHTIESTCFLLRDENGKSHSLFTGDTLFVDDVGRPDLFSGNLTQEELASDLFDSLQKLKKLPDDLIIYPAHGPGSACGKNLGPETFSTLGLQKTRNYALISEDKKEFIQLLTRGLTAPPSYFPINAKINQEGYDSMDRLLEKSRRALPLPEFKKIFQSGAILLDTRPGPEFSEAFIPGAINIGLEGRFAEWVGLLIPFQRPILLVTPDGREEETIIRMARVGFEQVSGYLEGGMQTWKNAAQPTDMIISIDPDELAMDMPYDPHLLVVDVRKPAEFSQEHVKGAINLSLSDMVDPMFTNHFWEHQNLYVHCQSGYRSIIACSLLKRKGIHHLRNISGGFNQIKNIPSIKIIQGSQILNG
ncbi:MAG: MBL fold metallo-hydrolase [Chitinophagaceae bacterium]